MVFSGISKLSQTHISAQFSDEFIISQTNEIFNKKLQSRPKIDRKSDFATTYFCHFRLVIHTRSNLARSFSSALFSILEMYNRKTPTFDVIVYNFVYFDEFYWISNNTLKETKGI